MQFLSSVVPRNFKRCIFHEERLVDLDKEVLPDPGTPSVETPAVEDGGEEVELDAVEPAVEVPAQDKFTNDLDPTPKTESCKSHKK